MLIDNPVLPWQSVASIDPFSVRELKFFANDGVIDRYGGAFLAEHILLSGVRSVGVQRQVVGHAALQPGTPGDGAAKSRSATCPFTCEHVQHCIGGSVVDTALAGKARSLRRKMYEEIELLSPECLFEMKSSQYLWCKHGICCLAGLAHRRLVTHDACRMHDAMQTTMIITNLFNCVGNTGEICHVHLQDLNFGAQILKCGDHVQGPADPVRFGRPLRPLLTRRRCPART